jgi:patatin-like phospholipase/acyl hydrolase
MAIKKKVGQEAKKEATEVTQDVAEVDNVDKIRDILFGNQMREFNTRFAQLETRLAADLELMRKDTSQQIESLQGYLESEIDSLGSRLNTEEAQRIQQMDELDDDLKKNTRQLEKKISDSAKELDRQARALNEKLLQQSKEFQQLLGEQIQQTRQLMDGYQQQLSTSKLDRSLLAELFNDVAMQLNQDDGGSPAE